MEYEVKYIDKDDSQSPCERIINIAGLNYEGRLWKVTYKNAILGAERGKWIFYIEKDKQRKNK